MIELDALGNAGLCRDKAHHNRDMNMGERDDLARLFPPLRWRTIPGVNPEVNTFVSMGYAI